MDYCADDYAFIAKRLKEISATAPVFWGIFYTEGSRACWCVVFGSELAAARPYSLTEPSRFSTKEEAEKVIHGFRESVNFSALSIREMPADGTT